MLGASAGAGAGAGSGGGAMTTKVSGSEGAECVMIYSSRFSDAWKMIIKKLDKPKTKSGIAKRGRNMPSRAYKKAYEDPRDLKGQ